MLNFFKDKRVFITGHTGFKGSWLSKILINAGSTVIGYSLSPETTPNLYNILNLKDQMISYIGDVRDFDYLQEVFQREKPDIVIHLAAQPIVRESYNNPRYTYETNIIGTVNVLECVRLSNTVKSFLNVTTDKVYKNLEWDWGYREVDVLDGYDPYSNSKSCSELVTKSYKRSFFQNREVSISTARAGNVIGGGDFSSDRIIPDCVTAVTKKSSINVRNPYSIRPYQHVLEPLFAYLLIVQKQYNNKVFEGHYNIGPDDVDCVNTGNLATTFCNAWGDGASWRSIQSDGPHEAKFLKLDCSLMKNTFNWKPMMNFEKAIKYTVDWTKAYLKNDLYVEELEKQIEEFNSKIKFLFKHEESSK
jgi:CDP-glucose 4,6-dehydratase